jgi:D-alanine-D-alanine ligase
MGTGEELERPLRVAVIAGGRSSEHEVSLSSGEGVREGLLRGGHEVELVTVGLDGVWRAGEEVVRLAPGEGLLGVDVAFPVLHGPFGEDGTVQGLLETLDVAYVGSGVRASALCLDKVLFKELMARDHAAAQVDFVGVDEARFAARREEVLAQLDALGLPVFVKPARLGSSVGIVRVQEREELADAIEQAFAHDQLVIVEALAPGIEVECGVLGSGRAAGGFQTGVLASKPGEIVLGDGQLGWYDYEAKYSAGGMELLIPARISDSACERVRELALATFARFECEGLARVDFFVDGERVLVNELNTMPGFTPTSVYPKLMVASGISYEQLLERLCRLALERRAAQRAYSW